jgi:Lysylphosphatidylglycerol synthase TM region
MLHGGRQNMICPRCQMNLDEAQDLDLHGCLWCLDCLPGMGISWARPPPTETRRRDGPLALLVMGALFDVSIYFANAWRWKILLCPVAPARFRRSLQAIYVGLFLNDVLPLRPGEIVCCGLLSRWTPDLRFTVAISSAMIERLFEFAWLVAGFFAVVAFTPGAEGPGVQLRDCEHGIAGIGAAARSSSTAFWARPGAPAGKQFRAGVASIHKRAAPDGQHADDAFGRSHVWSGAVPERARNLGINESVQNSSAPGRGRGGVDYHSRGNGNSGHPRKCRRLPVFFPY